MPPKAAAPRIPEAQVGTPPSAYTYIDLRARGRQAPQPPRVVFIEVTNYCNLLCETCPRTFGSYEEAKTLGWEDFLRVVEQFPDMQRAVLHGIGEPLINRDLPRMIEHLKARGVTMLFNTNATLLTETWGRNLIASGLDELRCSIDGASPRTYAEIRGAPLLPKIIQYLTRFTQLQRELGATTPRVSIWMTGMRENIHELPDLVRLAARMGVGEVYVQRMVYSLDEAQAPGMLNAGHALFDEFDALADRAIAEAEQVAAANGVRLQASGARVPTLVPRRLALSSRHRRSHQCLAPSPPPRPLPQPR